MECKQAENKASCECIAYHLSHNELPGCCFPENVEKDYDRSFARFVEIRSK